VLNAQFFLAARCLW